jgi:predicted GNAT superfamily acetyltransferase
LKFTIRDGTFSDISVLARLNEAEVPHVGELSQASWRHLVSQAFKLRVVEAPSGEIAGFLLALVETADYASMNFQWFKKRYPKFSYVDRIVVAKGFQRLGLGRMLYEDLERMSAAKFIACEVNIRPPNPGSIAFHTRIGLHEVGTQDTDGGTKTVLMMLKELR